jgi:hypothetical protein
MLSPPHYGARPGGGGGDISRGPIHPEQALDRTELDRLLDPAPLDAETGWRTLPDGVAYAAVRTEMPGVNADMVDWWFDWHQRDPIRYQIWFLATLFFWNCSAATRAIAPNSPLLGRSGFPSRLRVTDSRPSRPLVLREQSPPEPVVERRIHKGPARREDSRRRTQPRRVGGASGCRYRETPDPASGQHSASRERPCPSHSRSRSPRRRSVSRANRCPQRQILKLRLAGDGSLLPRRFRALTLKMCLPFFRCL